MNENDFALRAALDVIHPPLHESAGEWGSVLRDAGEQGATGRSRARFFLIAAAAVLMLLAGGATAATLTLHWGSGEATRTVTNLPITVQTHDGPVASAESGTAAATMSVFQGKDDRALVPYAVRSFWLGHGTPELYGLPQLADTRLLAHARRWTLYAVPTDRGLACYALTDGVSAGGSCVQTLDVSPPVMLSVNQDSATEPVVVAGIASDDVAEVTTETTSKESCQVDAAHNGVLCVFSPKGGAASVIGFDVRLRDGTTVKLR